MKAFDILVISVSALSGLFAFARDSVEHAMKQWPVALAVLLALELCPAAGLAGAEEDTDRPGQDFQNFDLSSADPALCQNACSTNQTCQAWTYVKPHTTQGPNSRCWLKTGVPNAVASTCCVSGVKGPATGTWTPGRLQGDWHVYPGCFGGDVGFPGSFILDITADGAITGEFWLHDGYPPFRASGEVDAAGAASGTGSAKGQSRLAWSGRIQGTLPGRRLAGKGVIGITWGHGEYCDGQWVSEP
jgi:hypothetical protein